MDVDFPPDPLKKKALGVTQLTGSVKFFVNLTHNGGAEDILLHNCYFVCIVVINFPLVY